MSLIQFRGRSILPPLINYDCHEEKDLRMKEDELILSLPSSEALQVILCGLPDHSDSELSPETKEEKEIDIVKPVNKDEKKYTNFKECNKNTVHKRLAKGHANKVTFIRYKPSASNLKNINSKDSIMQPSSSFAVKESGGESLATFQDSHNSWRNISSHKEDRISCNNFDFSKSKNFASPSTPPSSKVISGVTNHQKLKVLQASGTKSSSYLQDYLQLLTSRSEFLRVAKPKREAELRNDVFMERRGSAPLLPSKKCISTNSRQRNSSGSSDKSGSYRSLGSTYLDSYLGNLTDHSWIIYPTEETVSTSAQPIVANKSHTSESKSMDSNDGDYLQRRLRFINPEKFFTIETKVDTLEEPSHSTSAIKSSSSAENDNELGLTDTSGIVLSPDISISSLDTDHLDASNPLSLTSLQEIDELKESPKSHELSDNRDNTQGSSYNSDTSPEDKSLSSKNGQKENVKEDSNTPKLNVTFDDEPTEITSPRDTSCSQTFEDESTLEEEEEKEVVEEEEEEEEEEKTKDEESSIASDDSSDISTDEDAEDQVSMIVCDIQKSLEILPDDSKELESLHDESKESICDDSLIAKPNSNSLSQASLDISTTEKTTMTYDDISPSQELSDSVDKIDDKIESEGLMSKLIKILQAKQEEELRELRNRHEREMENFLYELSKLTSSQKVAIANAYESPNNNTSLNEILKVMNNASQSSSQASGTTEVDNNHKENYASLSSFNHTNLMPSFFLHDENQENNSIRRPDVNKISQIFTPSKGSIQTVANFLNLGPNLLAAKSSNDSNIQISVAKDLEQIDTMKPLFDQKQLELGLDLVPTRESDGVCTSSSSSNIDSMQEGISKFQAIVRGKRIRTLMRTSQVQQLLSTLKEVAKLAHQFHQDILMDNIRKGDIGFHKALYNEEHQAREKLINIMVDTNPADQIRLIERDRLIEQRENHRLIEQRENHRRVTTEQPRSNANHIPKLKLYSTTTSSTVTDSIAKIQSSPRSLLMSPYKGNSKQISRKVYTSELPRPCKAIPASESKSAGKHPCTSPRERQSFIPSQKSLISKGIPRHKILKKIDTLPLTHIPPRRHNAPICKSDSGYLSNAGLKPNKIDHNSVPLRGDIIPSRKPWR